MATQTNEIKKLLASKHVRELPSPKGEVVVVTSKETPYDAFKVKIKQNGANFAYDKTKFFCSI